jgi:hypothetical protein
MGAAQQSPFLKPSLTTHNRAAAFPQPNPHKPIVLAIPTKRNLVAILKKATLLP